MYINCRSDTFKLMSAMKLLVGAVLLCLVAVTCAAPRIVGGNDAPDGVYTYQVSLRFRNKHMCGGSIINKRWILTAAHCVRYIEDPTSIKVVAGTTLLHGGKEQVYQSEYIAEHEGFNLLGLQSDIALIRVSKDIEFNNKVQPIALTDKDNYEHGHPVKLTGWGETRGLASEEKLQEVDLKVYDQEKCKKEVTFAEITKSHICTLTKKGEGVCYGDSGGPLVADGIQVGIVSFGSPCARGMPDVFTRVYTFLDWIAAEQAKF